MIVDLFMLFLTCYIWFFFILNIVSTFNMLFYSNLLIIKMPSSASLIIPAKNSVYVWKKLLTKISVLGMNRLFWKSDLSDKNMIDHME